MRTVRSRIPRSASIRLAIPLVLAAITVAIVACRGSGSDPSPGDQSLPQIQPTVSDSQCINHVQPADAPSFDEIDFSRMEQQETDLRSYDIEEGTGETPALADAVSVEYTGWLPNGCMFDTSYPNEGPTTFPVLNVIRGWQRTFSDMKVGGTRVIEIGPSMGYGEIGFPPRIPPNATLIFHVDLIERITLADAQATVQAEIATATAEAESVRETAVAGGTVVYPPQCRNGSQPDSAPQFSEIEFDSFETLVEGVRFYDVVAGTGASPEPADLVSVEYTGWLESGCIFDTSYADEGPIEFPLSNLIEGWQVGIGDMKVGGTRVLEIAPELAYGDRGSGNVIPPGATITFYVELLDKS